MAPLPKRRHSSRRQAKRSRALKVARITLVKCKNCTKYCRPHTVCTYCGYYDGKPAIIKKVKKTAKKS